MQTNPAVEQSKNIKSSERPWNQSGTPYKVDINGVLSYFIVFVCTDNGSRLPANNPKYLYLPVVAETRWTITDK